MTSVVIAAHNEASVIGNCLAALQTQSEPAELDITVVANGCTDDTAARAGSCTGVRVVEIEVASKSAALNAGDAVADGFPRIYLDADILVTAADVHRLSNALLGQERAGAGVLAAVPRREVELTGRPIMVRSYFVINKRLPAFTSGLFGRGMIALSEEGRARFGRFPSMVADDLYLDSLFTQAEKYQVDSFATTVAAPLRTSDLVRRLVRVRRGNAAMRSAARSGDLELDVRPARRLAWLRQVVVPEPHLAPAAIAYLLITTLAALLARRGPQNSIVWARDESTRVMTPMHQLLDRDD